MKTRLVGFLFTVGSLLIAHGWASAQNQSTSTSPTAQTAEKKSGLQMQNQASNAAVMNAVKNDHFELEKGEYKLQHAINMQSSTAKSDNIKVDYQIGTIDNKPATISAYVDKDKSPKDAKEADAIFGVPTGESVRINGSEQQVLQKCTDGKKCVKTDSSGRCIKWVCP